MSRAWLRNVLLVSLVVVLSTYATYTTIRLRATYANERAVAVLKDKLEVLDRDMQSHIEMVDERVSLVEWVVFGDLEPKVKAAIKAPARPAAWSVNRDRELRKRIERLERLLYERDGKKD